MTKVTAFSLFHREAKPPWISLPRGNLAGRGPFGALSNSPRRSDSAPNLPSSGPSLFHFFQLMCYFLNSSHSHSRFFLRVRQADASRPLFAPGPGPLRPPSARNEAAASRLLLPLGRSTGGLRAGKPALYLPLCTLPSLSQSRCHMLTGRGQREFC